MADIEQYARKSPLWLSSSLLLAAQLHILCPLVVMSTCDRKPSTSDNGRPCQGGPEAQLVEWEHAMADPAREWVCAHQRMSHDIHVTISSLPPKLTKYTCMYLTDKMNWKSAYIHTDVHVHLRISFFHYATSFKRVTMPTTALKCRNPSHTSLQDYASHIFVFCQGTRVWANHP